MSKFTPWLSVASYALLTAACFMPWTYHADLGRHFTGFFTEANSYGRPGIFLLSVGGVVALCSLLPSPIAKWCGLAFSCLLFAFAIKTFLKFGSCYMGYCPEKKTGLFLMLFSTAVLLAASLFPKGRLMGTTKASDNPQA